MKAWKQQERQKLADSIPMSHQNLSDLFDYLDSALVDGCDHTLRLTEQFLRKCNVDSQSVVPWLNEHGGYCDCEVLANVEDKFAEIIAKH